MSQWAYTTTGGFNRRPNTDDPFVLTESCPARAAGAHPMYAVSPSGRDVLEHDVDLDRTGGIDLHFAAHEVPRKARREHVDVIPPRWHDDLEGPSFVRRGRGLHHARIAEVDRRADRGQTALVLDRSLHGHAAPENE